MGQPRSESLLLALQANTEAYYGRDVKARQLSEQAVGSALRTGQTEAASGFQLEQAFRESEFGSVRQAKKDLAAALAIEQKQQPSALAALALARTGETTFLPFDSKESAMIEPVFPLAPKITYMGSVETATLPLRLFTFVSPFLKFTDPLRLQRRLPARLYVMLRST